MKDVQMPELRIGNLTMTLPVIQGGMGVGVSLSRLASSVAKEGGIGVIAAAGIGMLEPDFNTNSREANKRALRKEIRKAREETTGVIGVNIMVALSDYDALSEVAMEEGADIIFMGAGLPLKIGQRIIESSKEGKIKICPIVSSGRAARIIFQYWARHYNHVPAAVVVEGPLASGHLGFKKEQLTDPDFALDHLIEEVLPVIRSYEEEFGQKIPVIAAGGIFTGEDIHRVLELGASGVQMATRFVATAECDASIEFKESYIRCRKEDIVIIDSPVGLPGRAIKNSFLADVSRGEKKPFQCPWKCLKTCDYHKVPYCIALALTNAKNGKLNEGFAFCGHNAYRVDSIGTVPEVISALKKEYAAASQ
ncbi:MAG TPA: nitronate monooxygenase [Candidatus Mcinerneyibacteriales bacterium]|nr:nitronate monooxygenase [Candidatus Mcinerneyibacteriales bacterium]